MTNELTVIEKESQDLVNKANSYQVKTQQDYEVGGEFLRAIKGLQKKVNETFDPIIESARKTWKESLSKKDLHFEPLEQAEKIVKTKRLEYFDEQERITREKQEKLEREARAEEERKRKALEERARKAEEAGKADKAEELRLKAEEVRVEAPIVQPRVENIKGESIREQWYAEVNDLLALVKAIAEGKAPITFIEANVPMLNKQAVSMKNTWSYPGVVFKSKRISSMRS
jgi:hypothetical protein